MAVQAWIIMDEAQKNAAMQLDNNEQVLGARIIDNSLADSLGEGALVGKWVAPARLMNDPEYERWVAPLTNYPIRAMDSETLFVPVVI